MDDGTELSELRRIIKEDREELDKLREENQELRRIISDRAESRPAEDIANKIIEEGGRRHESEGL